MLKPILFMTCLLPGLVLASLAIPGIDEGVLGNQSNDVTFAKTGLKQNIDDITDEQDIDKVKLKKQDTHTALVWELTDDDMRRYKLLMDNKSGVYYQGLRLTPLDILGINARNEAERERFADISAKFEAQKVAKNLAWNNAHFKAYQNIVKNIPVIQNFNPSKYGPHAYRPIRLKSGQQLHFYVKKSEPVTTLVSPLVKAIAESNNTVLVLNCVDCDSNDMQLWANNHFIPKRLVNEGRIRLDLGCLSFENLSLPEKQKKTPLLISVLNAHANLVDLGGV